MHAATSNVPATHPVTTASRISHFHIFSQKNTFALVKSPRTRCAHVGLTAASQFLPVSVCDPGETRVCHCSHDYLHHNVSTLKPHLRTKHTIYTRSLLIRPVARIVAYPNDPLVVRAQLSRASLQTFLCAPTLALRRCLCVHLTHIFRRRCFFAAWGIGQAARALRKLVSTRLSSTL